MRLQSAVPIVIFSIACVPVVASTLGYTQTNLTSDIPGLANNTDSNLKNPCGISFSATSPIWVSDQGTGVSTLYNGAGVPNALVVGIPPTPGGGPTGQVFNTSTGFALATGGKAVFLFATLSGTIDGWNGGTTAQVAAAVPGAAFTGLAQAGDTLYAADFAGGKIDTFNTSFSLTS